MHVAVGEANKRAGDAASGPENDIGIGAAGGADSLMLQGNRAFFATASIRLTTSG